MAAALQVRTRGCYEVAPGEEEDEAEDDDERGRPMSSSASSVDMASCTYMAYEQP